MTVFFLRKKPPQGPKVLDTIKSEVFICICAIRHGFNVRQMGGAVKVVFGNMPLQGHEEECFSLCPSFIVCVA